MNITFSYELQINNSPIHFVYLHKTKFFVHAQMKVQTSSPRFIEMPGQKTALSTLKNDFSQISDVFELRWK